MEENKTVEISVDAISKIDNAITSINELSQNVYNDALSTLPKGVLENKSSLGQNKFEKAFFWFNDHYEQVQSIILAIQTLSEYAQDNSPSY